MKKNLQRILSLLCVLALTLSAAAAIAESPSVQYDDRIVTIVWKDSDNYNGIRPASVPIALEGAVNTTEPLTEANGWTGQARIESGKPVSDLKWIFDVPEGYTCTQTLGEITTIRFYLLNPVDAPEDVSATVTWVDDKNARGARPESVQLVLQADGEDCGEPLIANFSNNWKVTWDDMPVKRPNAKEKIAYTVRQVKTPDSYSSSASGLNVTNTLQLGHLKLNASVSAPEGADLGTFTLTVQGPDPSMPRTLKLADVSSGSYDFGDVLPGAYLVLGSSAEIEGYTMDTENSKVCDAVMIVAGETATLEYKYTYKLPEAFPEDFDPDSYDPEKTDFSKLTFEILGPDDTMPLTITYAQFTNGRYELDNLKPGTYAVFERNAEKLVNYYTLSVDSVTGISLTLGANGTEIARLYNKYIPAPTPEPDAEFVDVLVTKTWVDNNNKDGNRPDSVTARLYADGVEVASHVLTEAEKWTYTFEQLPRYRDDNKTEIVYTVNEDVVPMYVVAINGFNIVNTYQPETTSLSVSKTWVHNGNAKANQPKAIYMSLVEQTENRTVETVELNEENGWTATVSNLPTTINGHAAQYGWKEHGVVGYTQTNVQQNGNAIIFTNAYVVTENPTKGGETKKVGQPFWYIGDYDTALGLDVIINHVGDCFD